MLPGGLLIEGLLAELGFAFVGFGFELVDIFGAMKDGFVSEVDVGAAVAFESSVFPKLNAFFVVFALFVGAV